MPLVASVDYPSRRIYLSADTLGISVQPVDVYKEVRALRENTSDHRKFLPLISARGNEPVGPSNTPILTVLANGARIVPFDTSHTLTIGGTIVSIDENLAGPDLFDRAPLSGSTDVDIAYRPPQVEVIEVEKPTAALDIAAAVWQYALEQNENGDDVAAQAFMRIIMAGMAGEGGIVGTAATYKSLDKTKDRIVGTVSTDGVRTNVTLDGD